LLVTKSTITSATEIEEPQVFFRDLIRHPATGSTRATTARGTTHAADEKLGCIGQ
jgi:hypothetical protein